MAQTWVVDTEPDPRFTLYTRGNVGEVFPHVITPLSGSLFGDAVRQGQLDVFEEIGVLAADEVSPSAGTGVFCGYLYMNASLMRLFGVRMPGLSAGDTDEQVMGDVEGVPPYVPSKGDRNLRASLNLVRYSIRLMRTPDLSPLDAARADAQAWLESMPDLTSASDDALLDWLYTYPPRARASMTRLLGSSMMVGAPRGILDRFLGRPGVPAGLANRMVGGTGDVDSARLAQGLWTLARIVAADPTLTAAFDDGLDGIDAWIAGTALRPALDDFLAAHGHRGNDEYELATPAWVMDPAPVFAAIERLRHAPEERDPNAATERLGQDAQVALAEALQLVRRPLRRLVRRAANVSRLGSIARERAKDILVLENLGARRALHELVHRAHQRGGPGDVRRAFCVTIDELPEFLVRPADFAAVIDERATLQAYLDARVPPPWFDGRIPDPDTWTLRSDARLDAPAQGTTIDGIAVSGGSATGPAKVITDPGDPRGLEPGEVLVCAITDPSWTPLFLGAVAVVCDTGAVQSHAAIVARELGIPAVLSVPGITSIADGTVLHVDGDAGTVRIG